MQANTSDDDEVLGSPVPTSANTDAHAASTRAVITPKLFAGTILCSY